MADDVLVVLQQAINMEQDRKDYYEAAAEQACNALAQQTFAFLAAQEGEHAGYITRFYTEMQETHEWPDTSLCGEECKLVAQEIGDIFSNARANVEGDVTCDTDLSETYKMGMQAERESIDFYRKQLDKATDPNARAFYEALLDVERMHLELLANTETFLTDPETWYFEQEQWTVEG